MMQKKCPVCGRSMMIRTSYRGKFWGCSGYNLTGCRYTADYIDPTIVGVGDTVRIRFENTKDEFDVTIMRYTEEYDEKCADYVSKTYNFMEDGKLSERSLLGRSIVGTKVGECCKYKAPDGKQVVVRVLSLKKDRAGNC